MKQIFVALFSVLLAISAFAEKATFADVSGHIVNKLTGEHIPYCQVAIKGTTIGTMADATGHYHLKNLPTGKQTITFTNLGYKPVEKEIILTAGKNMEVNFETEEDAVQLDGVVVSANRNEVNRKQAATIVNLITPKLFENTNSVCLAQGLNYQPGLRVETNCQNCGFQQVRINGLDGPYSQILIDSRPIFSALAGVYGIEQIPTNMIERVEVVRGGGSALFGSSAIAGVINIITKEPTSNSATVSNSTSLTGGKKADINTTFNASVVSDDNSAGIMIFGSSRQRSPFDYDGDGFTEIGKLDTKTVGFRGFFKTGDYSKLTIEYHNLGEFRRGGNKLDLPPHEADITEQIEHNIHTGGMKYDIFSKNNKHRFSVYASIQNINRKSYYGAQKDPNAYGKTSDITYVAGAQYTYSMDKLLFMPAELTTGAEYSSDKMNDEQLGYDRTIDQHVHTKSAFAQNEWKNKELSILLGVRLDKHNRIKDPIISPRLNFRYAPSEHVNFRASYSSGFRAPQAFDEDLHITAVGGHVSLIELDPNLKTEKSQSYSASVDLYEDFGKTKANLLVEGFYTNLDNVFVLQEMGKDSGGNLILERTNGAGAVVKGINLEGKFVPTQKVQVQFGMTFQKSEYKQAQQWSENTNLIPHKRMFRAPNQYGYLTANYQPTKPMVISLSGTYTGSMLVQHFAGYIAKDAEKETANFYDLNLKLAYNFKLHNATTLQLNAGVQNVFNSYQKDFDKGQYRDASYIYGPALPRTYFAGLKFSI